MQSVTNLLRDFWLLLARPTPEQKEVMGELRPFYIVLTLILGIASIIVAYNAPQLQSPLPLIGFIAVMLLHISLHWLSRYSLTNIRWSVAYLAMQSLLGLMAIVISGAPELVLAIFATMIGETMGIFGTSRLSWSAVFIFLILIPLSYLLVGGVQAFQNWMAVTVSTMILLIIFMVLFRRQLDARRRAQALAAELETANRQLAEYAAQIEELTLVAERQRMARELHDILSQGVAGLVLQLEAVKAHLAAGRNTRAAEIIGQTLARARSTLADSRAAIDDLRAIPASLREAIRAKVERFTQATGIPCELDIAPGDRNPVPAEVGEHVERILSEALANVTRHAQATHVWVRYIVQNEQMELEIHDNGQGFDPETLPGAGHYGLLGMRERARLTGGTLAIETGIGQGTRIHLLIPINRATPAKGGTP